MDKAVCRIRCAPFLLLKWKESMDTHESKQEKKEKNSSYAHMHTRLYPVDNSVWARLGETGCNEKLTSTFLCKAGFIKARFLTQGVYAKTLKIIKISKKWCINFWFWYLAKWLFASWWHFSDH